MQIELQIHKEGALLFEGTYNISDPESLGRACADAWTRLRQLRFGSATSIGDLMDRLESDLDDLDGMQIRLANVEEQSEAEASGVGAQHEVMPD